MLPKFDHIDSAYIPELNSSHWAILNILADQKPHAKKEILMASGDDPRWTLQCLIGERFNFWLIHNTTAGSATYQLDSRQVTGEPQDDTQAHLEANERYRSRSRKQAESEENRLPKAQAQYLEALGELEAANDTTKQ